MLYPDDTRNAMVESLASIERYFANAEYEDSRLAAITARKAGVPTFWQRIANTELV